MTSVALNQYLKRLQAHSVLADDEQQAILTLPGETSTVVAHRELVRPGDQVDRAILVCHGLLGRYDLMRDGSRQITALHVPGDLCDLHSVVAPTTGWGINALEDAGIYTIPHNAIRQLVTVYPNLAMVFWRDATLDASILAKWVANIGRKSALARIAHLLCEIGLRLEAAGLGHHKNFALSLTQEQIGDMVGLTPVHENRTIKALREQRLVTIVHGRVDVLDWGQLTLIADFVPTYLLPYRQHHLPDATADRRVIHWRNGA